MSSTFEEAGASSSPIDKPSGGGLQIRDVLRLIAVAAFFIIASFVINHTWIRNELFDIEHLRTRFQGHGFRVQMIFLLAAAGLNAVGVPRLWVSAVAGTLFGSIGGSALALLATMGGCTVNFYMGRYLLRGTVMRLTPGKMKKRLSSISCNGFRSTLYLRLFPFSNSTITNFGCGASYISYKNFIGATLIGFLPLTVIFATLGSSAAKASHLQMAFGLASFVALLVGQRTVKKLWLKCGSDR